MRLNAKVSHAEALALGNARIGYATVDPTVLCYLNGSLTSPRKSQKESVVRLNEGSVKSLQATVSTPPFA